ncbi:MAG TPA: NAD(P)-dependent oxidoreductase [Fimbriimonadaceae bacterium]|nr:NAD(P)-dependent oxidoreductase [Fimbriimonadaceae bacterium]
MKVLVADKLEKSALDGLAALGCEVVSNPELADQALHDALTETGAEALVVRSTKVPREVMQGSKLRLIVRAGAGYNTIDVDAATEQGIYVTNCPGKNSIAVAELAFGLMLSLDRFIPDNVSSLRAHKWNKKGFGKGKGLYGKTLGIIGFGSIGNEVAVRAKAFGMDVIVFSLGFSDKDAAAHGVKNAASLHEIAKNCDIVTVHVALTPETKGMIDASFFGAMRPGAFFINTSRGEVVVQSDLVEAVKSGHIVAGLDVFDGEPAATDSEYNGELCSLEGVYVTHHIGASTEQAQEAVAEETVRIVKDFIATGTPPNAVNEPAARV